MRKTKLSVAVAVAVAVVGCISARPIDPILSKATHGAPRPWEQSREDWKGKGKRKKPKQK